MCIPCQEPFSVKHFLLDCTDFRIIRSRFYRVNSLKELFDTVEPVRIFSFLKEIGLYDKIKFSKVEVCLTTFDFFYMFTQLAGRDFILNIIYLGMAVDRHILLHTRLSSF